ncbi:putative kinesin [Aaosphaeria arxii CBS 175.79]|uniref:Putative kinesin n=1 Tax=Aaosphaeria arxii CBS 175.79 TaxID=1450172 RepID=A0A6A5X5T0_9PLEO|nr:putative kinesin [Aaosphaeria arxii CBS 175.79]KAF2008328.1 putative kinesin [Aaosphaeria arxii CBS 175.79]
MALTASFGDMNYGVEAGIINGDVNPMINLPPERRETPPQPSIVIPFSRDADFVDRGTLLDEFRERCTQPNARIALVGLGGVGKSQLAIEHAYRTREQSSETWVLWAHASNAARLEQSFYDIADRVRIVGRQDSQANIFKLVHDWLCDSKQPWLLVLDNVDDASFLLEAQPASSKTAARPLREYLPHCEHGSMLITSRSKEAARKLVEQRDIITLGPMDEAQSLALLGKKQGVQPDKSNDAELPELAELAAALEYIPLAITQAAAYIVRSAPRCSVARYLEEFRRSDGGMTSLLNHEAGHLRRDKEAKNSIIITWQISFEHLRRYKPSAAELLSLMSFFDRQGIPESLIRGGQEAQRQHKESDGDDNSDGRKFENDIAALRDLCLISINTDHATFEMHSLVQLATRRWLFANGKLEQWKQVFITSLCAAFPTGKYENWAACQALFAHAKAAAGQKPEATSSLIEWATLLYRAAWYAKSKGSAAEAESLAIQSMKVRKMVLGREHEDTVWSIAMVAHAYSLSGRWDAAGKLRAQVMETSKKKLGADHPYTLTSMADLASTYRKQGRWDAAEELEVQKLGADHPSTLSSMGNLASTLRNQGRWDAAEELEVQVMETSKKKLGANHPDTLTSMANLAWTWKSLERSAEAIGLLQECVHLRCQTLRAGHPDLVFSQETLAEWEAEQAGRSLAISS